MQLRIWQLAGECKSIAVAVVAALAPATAASADTAVYNVLTGQNREPGGIAAITPAMGFVGPVAETTGTVWNGFSDNAPGARNLYTSTGVVSTVKFASDPNANYASGGSAAGYPSPSFYDSYIYGDHDFSATFSGLNPASTYDLVIIASNFYNNARWDDPAAAIGVELTAGSGLTGRFNINRDPAHCLNLAWRQDTNPADTYGDFNYARLNGLSSDATGKIALACGFTGRNSINGYQLIEHPSLPLDHFEVMASSPQQAGSTFSVTVTAKDIDGKTIASDSTTVVTMTSSTGNAQFDGDGNGTFGDNTKTLTSGMFTIMSKDNVVESATLTASGGGKTGTSPAITVIMPLQAETVTFGTGANQFALTFNPVTSAYRVGNTEIPNDAFNKFYLTTKGVACARNAGLPLTDAACNVSGIEVVDFINWLNTSSGLPAAYTFNADHTALLNWNRTPGAKFFLPTVAEWNGALASMSYAFGPCIYEWIQDAAGTGGYLDAVENWCANKSFDESSFIQVYEDTGFRVMSDSSVSLTTHSPFDAWIAGAPLTGFADDPNQDGVANGLAWLLNGSAMGDSRTCLPVATTVAGGKLVLIFQCLKASARGTAVLNVQYSNDLGVLDTWHTAAVPDVTLTVGGVVFTVAPITASDFQTITAGIPLSAASSDGKLFGRLQGTP